MTVNGLRFRRNFGWNIICTGLLLCLIAFWCIQIHTRQKLSKFASIDGKRTQKEQSPSLSLAYDPSCVPCAVTDERFHLVTNFFHPVHTKWRRRSTNPHNLTVALNRLDELLMVLNLKLADTRVAAVHLLYNHPFTSHFMHKSHKVKNKNKLVLHQVEQDPTYIDAIKYSNKYLLDRTVIFLNQDIILGEGFEKVNRSILCEQRVTYALSRYGRREKFCTMPSACGNGPYMGSHDTFVYCLQKPISLQYFVELNSKSDDYGVENLWIWAFRQLKFKVLNPCLLLKTYHVHCSRFYNKKRDRINTKHGDGAGYTDKLY